MKKIKNKFSWQEVSSVARTESVYAKNMKHICTEALREGVSLCCWLIDEKMSCVIDLEEQQIILKYFFDEFFTAKIQENRIYLRKLTRRTFSYLSIVCLTFQGQEC